MTCRFAEKSAGTGERADGFFREPLYPSGQGIENSARAITGARDLRRSGAGSLCIWLCLPNRKRDRGSGPSLWDFVGVDRTDGCRSAFYNCAGFAPDRAQSNDQTTLPRDDI